jgi:hypothetical protein
MKIQINYKSGQQVIIDNVKKFDVRQFSDGTLSAITWELDEKRKKLPLFLGFLDIESIFQLHEE